MAFTCAHKPWSDLVGVTEHRMSQISNAKIGRNTIYTLNVNIKAWVLFGRSWIVYSVISHKYILPLKGSPISTPSRGWDRMTWNVSSGSGILSSRISSMIYFWFSPLANLISYQRFCTYSTFNPECSGILIV